MSTTVITIKRVNKFDKEATSDVCVSFEVPIKGFAFDKESNAYVETNVDHISFGSWGFEKVLCSLNDDIDYFRAMLGCAFNRSIFIGLLYKAKLTINRQLYKKGDEFNGKVLDRDKYITDVVDVKLSEKGQMFLDAAIDSIMSEATKC